MANYATNIFYASTENQNDLNKIEAFLDDNFSCYANKYGNSVDAEFPSRWEYPEKEMDQLVASLEAKDKVYIKILTYEFENLLSRQVGNKNIIVMSNRTFDNESDIIGLSCTLSTAYKGYTEGVIVDDYGTTIVVRLESGKEISVFRDEIIIHD